MDELELKSGLERLGVDVGNSSMVITMMLEAGAQRPHAHALAQAHFIVRIVTRETIVHL